MMSEQEKQYIVKQRALGKSFVQIGRELGRGESSVRYVFNHIMDEETKADEVIPTAFLGTGTSGTPKWAASSCSVQPAAGTHGAMSRNAAPLTAGSASSAGVSLLPLAIRINGSAAGNVLQTAGKRRR